MTFCAKPPGPLDEQRAKPYPRPERKKVDGHPKTSGKLQPSYSRPAAGLGVTQMGHSGLMR